MANEAPSTAGDGLQFDKAEFSTSAALNYRACKGAIADSYFTVNGVAICPECRRKFGDGRAKVTPEALLRAAGIGLGAAILGAIVWGGVRTAFNINLGLIAIAVGWAIGNAVLYGSGGARGWIYQALAMVLTYVCIALSVIPEIIGSGHVIPPERYFAVAIALAGAPILLATSSILGFIIYGFAFYEAWKINRRVPLNFSGPLYVVAAPAPALEAAVGG